MGKGGEETQRSGLALRSLRRGSARGRARAVGGTADQSAGSVPSRAQDWSIRSSLSPGRGRAAPGTAWDRRARCAQVPGARARSGVSRGGWSRAASRRSCWRRRRRRRLAVGRGRGLKTPRWGQSGVSGFFIRCSEGRRTEGCGLDRAEERIRASGSAAAGSRR